jgi:hypothetical protein
MTAIHHATIAKAKKAGIALSRTDDEIVIARTPDFTMQGSQPKVVLAAAMLQLAIFADEATFMGALVGHTGSKLVAALDLGTDDEAKLGEWDYDEPIPAILVEITDALDRIDNPEEEITGSVVKPLYKARYKANGDPTSCNDWLRKELRKWTQVVIVEGKKKTRYSYEKMRAILAVNEAKIGIWDLNDSGPSDAGRHSMSGRLALEEPIWTKGHLLIPVEFLKPGTKNPRKEKHPGDWTPTSPKH